MEHWGARYPVPYAVGSQLLCEKIPHTRTESMLSIQRGMMSVQCWCAAVMLIGLGDDCAMPRKECVVKGRDTCCSACLRIYGLPKRPLTTGARAWRTACTIGTFPFHSRNYSTINDQSNLYKQSINSPNKPLQAVFHNCNTRRSPLGFNHCFAKAQVQTILHHTSCRPLLPQQPSP